MIVKSPSRNKKLSEDELKLFFDALKGDSFWFDFAVTQFFCAGRVSEIAGLQRSSVDLSNRHILIKDTVVWSKKTKKFVELKELPKNGEIRTVYISDLLYESLSRRVRFMGRRSGFVFSIDGGPVGYRQVQYHYDNALKTRD